MQNIGVPNRTLTSNKINRCKYPLYLLPIIIVYNYFKSGENIYFLILSCFQLSTIGLLPASWSPTGPFSTAIPLLLCVVVEIIIGVVKWIIVWTQDKRENEKIYTCIFENMLEQIKNKDIYPGHIIRLKTDDICPVDGLVIGIDTGVDSLKSKSDVQFNNSPTFARVNLSLLTGESAVHHIPKFFYN